MTIPQLCYYSQTDKAGANPMQERLKQGDRAAYEELVARGAKQ